MRRRMLSRQIAATKYVKVIDELRELLVSGSGLHFLFCSEPLQLLDLTVQLIAQHCDTGGDNSHWLGDLLLVGLRSCVLLHL
jgi:hypothetical protein